MSIFVFPHYIYREKQYKSIDKHLDVYYTPQASVVTIYSATCTFVGSLLTGLALAVPFFTNTIGCLLLYMINQLILSRYT